MQTEIERLSDEYDRQAEHCCGVKDRFITTSTKGVDDHNRREAARFGQAPPSSSSAPPQAPQASETMPSPPPQDQARVTEEVAPEETARVTTLAAPEEIVLPSSLAAVPEQTSSLKLITLPSASEVKESTAAEKRKASAPPAGETMKKLKMAPVSSNVPIDAIPISSAPSTRNLEEFQIVSYGVDYVIPPADEEEDTHSAATTEQVDEEIEVEADASLH